MTSSAATSAARSGRDFGARRAGGLAPGSRSLRSVLATVAFGGSVCRAVSTASILAAASVTGAACAEGTGPEDVRATSVVGACCNCVEHRKRAASFERLLWRRSDISERQLYVDERACRVGAGLRAPQLVRCDSQRDAIEESLLAAGLDVGEAARCDPKYLLRRVVQLRGQYTKRRKSR